MEDSHWLIVEGTSATLTSRSADKNMSSLQHCIIIIYNYLELMNTSHKPCFLSSRNLGICHFSLWSRRCIRVGGSTAPYLIKWLSVWDKTGRERLGGGRHIRGERILMTTLPPLARAGKQTEWLPSTTLKPLLHHPLDVSLWHDFTNSLQKDPVWSITCICTVCAAGPHHIWEEDMPPELRMGFKSYRFAPA